MGRRELVVFVSEHCPCSKDAIQISQRIQNQYPDVKVKVVNVDVERPDPAVFAVPTYMLDGRIVSLGNPTDEQIADLLTR